nr:hypothetical protein [Tanacetum cinerariifolium]
MQTSSVASSIHTYMSCIILALVGHTKFLHRLAISSDNAQCAVTYRSISSDSDGPSWGIPLMNAGEFLKMDPYEEVAQQGQAHPLSPAYVPDPVELDKHVPVYVPEPKHPEYHAPSDDDIQAPFGHKAAMICKRDDILKEDMPPHRIFAFTAYPPGCDVAESSAAAATRASRSHYDFVDTVEASERRMMTSIEEVNLRVSYHAQVRRALLAQLETLETHMSRMKWLCQSAEDLAVTQMMRIHILKARARTDTVEDVDSSSMIDREIQRNSTHTQDDESQSLGRGLRRPVQPARVCSYTDFIKCQPLNFKGTEGVVGLSQWLKKMESVFHINGCAIDNQVKFATCTLLGATLTWWNGYVRTLGHDAAYALIWGTLKKKMTDKYCSKELTLMCTIFLADETKKVDKYISGLPDNIHRNVMSARPKTLDETIELANDLMDQKLCTYVERQNDNKRKTDDSSRNGQRQQPHKKQNVARAYTAGPGEKKRYVHTTMDCRVNTNNNIKNQKAGTCYECGNTGHIKKNSPKLKNHGNGNENGVAQGRAYVLRGRDASSDSNVITGNGDNQREESRLNIISCTKAQEYLLKGCDVFLAHVTTKEAKDKSEGK